MNETLYQMIFKRKSFHLFRGLGDESLSQEELEEIKRFYQSLTPLCPEIRTAIQIVPEAETTNRHGQEYCIAFYSEKKGNYLQNIGYLGQKIDLFLASKNIAACWYGIGKARQTCFQGLDYVIMIAIKKADDPAKFRRDMFKAKRKAVSEIWQGEPVEGITDIVRFAPSACNSQPWAVENDGSALRIYRCKKPGMLGIMPADKAGWYNRIDMGIFLCFMELCLEHEKIACSLELHPDEGAEQERTLNAVIICR